MSGSTTTPVRARAVTLLVGAAVTVMLALATLTGAPHAAGPADAAAPPTTTVAAPPTTFAENVFIPEDRNLSDCVSAIPQPGCGSEGRGGWRQLSIFGVMTLAMLFIAWRIFRSVRRRDATA